MDLCEGAAQVDDLFRDYECVLNQSCITSATNLLPVMAGKHLSRGDEEVLLKYLCTCPMAACNICRGISLPSDWLLDSGASVHFIPVLDDLVNYKVFPIAGSVGTASSPLQLARRGQAFIKYQINLDGGRAEKIMRINALYVPHLQFRILSLG